MENSIELKSKHCVIVHLGENEFFISVIQMNNTQEHRIVIEKQEKKDKETCLSIIAVGFNKVCIK